MKKYIILALLGGTLAVHAQDSVQPNVPDTIQLGYRMQATKSNGTYSARSVDGATLEKSPQIDIAKALYGKIAGLNVYQGTGSSAENLSILSIHGNAPLVLVDGFPRNLSDITTSEIESVQILKDAVASALYGVRGANGVVLVTTKRGHDNKLKVSAKYQYGISTQFRKPVFADAYTYAASLTQAQALDGLQPTYNERELAAFQNNTFPYEYPNINWWDEVYNTTSDNHRLNLTFDGGSKRFRYYTVVDYMHDRAFFKKNTSDNRYDTNPTDVRLNIRTNIDVELTESTFFKVNIAGKLMETNGADYLYKDENNSNSMSGILYNLPSAAFPVRYEDGTYGGNSVYGANNPVALMQSTGAYRTTYGTLLADIALKQHLDMIVKGLTAEVSVSFDNSGSMFDAATKTYRYMYSNPSLLPGGTLVTTPVYTGKDSEILSHGQDFSSLFMRSDIQAKIDYRFNQNKHNLYAALIYDQQAYTTNGRNKSNKRQSSMLYAAYTYDNRYSLSGVMNYSGTAYLPEGHRFHLYPALSAAWIISNEKFFKGHVKGINQLKLYASYGISGWDGNMTHELWRQSYGGTNAGAYFFTNNATQYYGQSEGPLPVENLVPEKSKKFTFGVEAEALDNRLSLYAEAFQERRSNILVPGSTIVSGIIGIDVGQMTAGIHEYKGFDASLSWRDRIGKDFTYGIGTNVSYVDSKLINDNQAYQPYDYLYHKGNRIGQYYGLEAIGFFHDQMEINNSPSQTFSTVRPGDIKYKDQNGDNKIDDQDMVKMFGTSIPRFYFGLNLSLTYKGFELSADFQGLTGFTTSLLNSPLYMPLVENGNISKTFLDREVTWTPENATQATMPRLTTQANANNYRANSLWYRDGSYIKLRNLYLAYNFPKKMVRFADVKLYLQGTDIFSLDNIKFADPEQLGAVYPSVRSYWLGLKFNF